MDLILLLKSIKLLRAPKKKLQGNKNFVYAEGKKTQNWFQMPLTGQMSEVEDGSDGEFETAIGAAAYAITLQKEESSLNQKKPVEELGGPLIKTKSKREESMNKLTDSSKISRWFSGKDAKEDGKSSGSKRFEFGQNQGGQQAPFARKPTVSFSGNTDSFSRKGNANVKTTNSTTAESKADAWEKEKMAKIKKRYEKMKVIILEWENEHKMKAKCRLERKEVYLDYTRIYGAMIAFHFFFPLSS
ncbi:putative remorin 4.2 [Cocos nucifera]|uniref:Putative remorin 4.2 n=1 Tax=Cocos nucifera TaxID=13894 RepID=A0A8K0ITG6_COCNU|nr:putative remorin 4.2 [Cocos nucifera]